MKTRIEAKKGETRSQIDEWKTNREHKKLENRAQDSEDYAAWAVYVAAASIDEAEAATLEAIEARMLVEETD